LGDLGLIARATESEGDGEEDASWTYCYCFHGHDELMDTGMIDEYAWSALAWLDIL
jgi:hypothetical protein